MGLNRVLMDEQIPQGLREQIVRIVRDQISARIDDRWVDSAYAANYLKMSKYLFLRLCRANRGPEGHGVSARLKRCKISELDRWMQHRETQQGS